VAPQTASAVGPLRKPGRGGNAWRVVTLVLASRSPRRVELLRSAGLLVEVRPVDCDETPHPGEPAVAYARRIAAAKLSLSLAHATWPHPTLAADTVVWSETTAAPLGKPRDREHARQVLRQLAGTDHFVTTAWILARPGAEPRLTHETTRVWMRSPADDELERYLDTDEWRDKAGGYGIQGHAAGLVVRLEGSYTNVVGLPLAQVLAALEEASRP